MTLTVSSDGLAACVSCGLCLPHCPTYRATGDESRSPRGRIAAMRALEAGSLSFSPDVVEAMETCVQCRACETACPSAVPFGELMTATRDVIAAGPRRWRSLALGVVLRLLAVGPLLRTGSTVLAVAQRLRLVPSRRLGLPRSLPLRRPALRATGDDVVLFTGCVMDAWQRSVHADALTVIGATGAGVALSPSTGCCGALAEHAGLAALARRQAERTMAANPGDAPILVDSAGCGAMLKDYGRLLGTPDAARFSARVLDVHEWLDDHASDLPDPRPDWIPPRVAVQDPCHLRHVQRRHLPVRSLLRRVATLAEIDDDGRCCGAGGAFAVTQPALADDIRATKVAAIEATGSDLVASANPGCSIHLDWAGVPVSHPVTILADALGSGAGDG